MFDTRCGLAPTISSFNLHFASGNTLTLTLTLTQTRTLTLTIYARPTNPNPNPNPNPHLLVRTRARTHALPPSRPWQNPIFRSQAWSYLLDHALCVELKSQHRFGNDPKLCEILAAIRTGAFTERHLGQLAQEATRPLPAHAPTPVVLAGRRRIVHEHNSAALARAEKEGREAHDFPVYVCRTQNLASLRHVGQVQGFIKTSHSGRLPPLRLALGLPIMFLANLSRKLCNGTMGALLQGPSSKYLALVARLMHRLMLFAVCYVCMLGFLLAGRVVQFCAPRAPCPWSVLPVVECVDALGNTFRVTVPLYLARDIDFLEPLLLSREVSIVDPSIAPMCFSPNIRSMALYTCSHPMALSHPLSHTHL